MAMEFSKSVKAGEVKVKEEHGREDTGRVIDDEKVPF
jgi:hypothetical protein